VQTLGLSKTDRATYLAALSHSYVMGTELRVLTLDGTLVTNIKPAMQDGQVNIDTSGDVTRSATMTFQDPGASLQFSPDSPGDGAVYFNNMVQVRVSVYVEALGDTVTCPVFTGPIVKFDRTGDLVSLEAQGKESFGLNGCPTLTLRKGHNAVDAIHDILSMRTGETKFSLPQGNTRRLPSDVHASWDDDHQPWKVCKNIAASLGMQLYYDGAGVCRLRDLPGAPVYTFRDGDGGNITAPVAVSHDKTELRNQVHVVGKKPAHQATANLPDWHPASSWNLRRNGHRTYLRVSIQDNKIGSTSAAKARANNVLDQYLRLHFGCTFSALPVFPLEELDLVHISTDQYTSSERLRQASFPITGGDMTFGYTDVVSAAKHPRRRP